MSSSNNEQLESIHVEWTEQHSCGVVIASEGYPEKVIYLIKKFKFIQKMIMIQNYFMQELN
jgi:phosphoribosylamine-glycine ligase